MPRQDLPTLAGNGWTIQGNSLFPQLMTKPPAPESRDFKQLTTTTPKWTTGSEDAQFARTAHAIDETSVVVHL